MSASYLRKYATGSGADIYINIPKAGSADHAVSADWTPAAGDVKISIDGGTAANIGTLPTAIAMGNSASWKFVFTNSELTGKIVHVTVSDSATKAVDDTGFTIETYGNASALHPFDLGTASTAQTGDNYAIVNSGTYGNSALKTLIDAITGYVDTEVAAIKAKTDNLTFTASGKIDANVLAISGSTDAADNLELSTTAIVVGTVGSSSTTTSIVTSALDPSAIATDQFIGRIVTFDKNTPTTQLRGQATDITGSSSGGVLTVSALSTAPALGDTFVIT